MVIKRTVSERVFEVFNILFLIFLSLITMYPLLYVLFASFSDSGDLARHHGLLLKPYGIHLEAYKLVFKNPIVGTSYFNTLFNVAAGLIISMILTTVGAYCLSRLNLKWGTAIMMVIVFTMWFSGGTIPFYLTVSSLGIPNTRWAMILPRAISTYNLIVMRTAFQQLPPSLEESARLDGANDLVILTRIIVPIAMPTIAVITLFYASSQWNAWFDAMMFINKRTLFPLQLFLREILVLNSTDSMMAGNVFQGDQVQLGETIKYATVMIATVPILCVYPFLQKYFVKGVMIGAVKG
ncbi:putative ABC transporter permease protein YtcP [Clostridia bacterium]|nr:putative ABC transporter permease protein YtcP [Clostridia bacterium]